MLGRRNRFAVVGGIIAAAIAFAPAAEAGILTGFLQQETGPQNAVVWELGVTNIEATPATNAMVDSASLAQTAGAACTPVLTLPGPLGTIAPGATVPADLTIDFTGCSPFDTGFPPDNNPTLRFTLDVAFTADGFTGSLELTDLTTKGDGTVFPPSEVPEPTSWALLATALAAAGLSLALAKPRLRSV